MGFQLVQTFATLPEQQLLLLFICTKQNPSIHRKFYFKEILRGAIQIIELRKYVSYNFFLDKIENGYLIGPFYAGPNLTPAPFTPALITPLANFGLTPIRAAYYANPFQNIEIAVE